MDDQTVQWNEYQILRAEIAAADVQKHQTLVLMVGGFGAILTAGFNQQDPERRMWMFLSTFAITWPGYYLMLAFM